MRNRNDLAACVRLLVGDDQKIAVGILAVFFMLMLTIGAGIYFLARPSLGTSLSVSQHSVPVPSSRDWRGALPSDKL